MINSDDGLDGRRPKWLITVGNDEQKMQFRYPYVPVASNLSFLLPTDKAFFWGKWRKISVTKFFAAFSIFFFSLEKKSNKRKPEFYEEFSEAQVKG